MFMIYLITALILIFLGLYIWHSLTETSCSDLKGKHVLVTGGSSGIGLKLAEEVLLKGANVTLYARNTKRLEEARTSLTKVIEQSVYTKTTVHIQSVDMNSSRKVFAKNLNASEQVNGPIFMLINCAGFAKADVFENLEESLIKTMFETNVYGSIFLTQEVIKRMKIAGTKGFISFVSSQAGLFGFYGFSVYSACKSAIIKIAEALHMEVKPFGISVTVCLPPDTDTPGFHEEEKSKPVECKLISGSAGLTEPKVIARSLLEDTLRRRFYSTVGLEGFMLRVLGGGMAPINSILDFTCQVFLIGVFKSVSIFYLFQFNNIVHKEYKKKVLNKKLE